MTFEPCAAALALAAVASPANAAACVLAGKPETVAIERAIDGDTVELDDGRRVRLAGVAAPKAPIGAKPADWPLDESARKALERLAAGKVLEFRAAGAGADRHGRLTGFLSEIEAPDHAGIAVELLREGLARTAADSAGRGCGATLASAENHAIGARLGLWSEAYYAVRNAADGPALADLAGRFVVADGRVASVRTSAGRAYVNFGERWRDALSLSLSEATLRKFGGFETLGVKVGARVRARGVIEARPGPVIFVTEAAQIERLDGRDR